MLFDSFGRVCQMIRVNNEPFLKGVPDYSCIPTIHPACVCEQRSCTYFAKANNFVAIPNWLRFSVIAQLESIWMGIESKFVPVSTQSQLSCVKSPWVEVYCLRKGFTMVYYRNLLTRGSANNPANWNSKQFTNISHNQVPTSVKIT
jgi:hypothetical protein